VAEAIRVVRPFAVDVNSGVEARPGRKDPDRVRRFMQAVGAALEQVA
jgi:phosphoribosylanthranilate isomerase